jgi:4-diphosphocytidyl-2-C-methyl-D-erythritol kinase
MQTVDLCDRLDFWDRPAGDFGISVSGLDGAPADATNLALRAARLLAEASGCKRGAHVHIEKRIPTGGGLGGGSSDAACALRGLNMLWELGASRRDMEAAGARLGSDINFFLTGGLALCRGRGEVVEPLRIDNPLWYLLHVPQVQVMTRDIYSALIMPLTDTRRQASNIVNAISRAEWPRVGQEMFNRLEEAAFRLHPALAEAKSAMRKAGTLGSLLSGSGATVYAATLPGSAEPILARLRENLRSGALLACGPVGPMP